MVKKTNRAGAKDASSQVQHVECLELDLEVLHFDENQPRKTIRNIPGLAASIKSQGLQQAIVVNRWKMIDGVMHYIIDKGERRTTAHDYLVKHEGLTKFKRIKAIVQKDWYDGKPNTARKLAQYAENDQREPQTKKETVELLRELVEEERQLRRNAGESEHGAIQIGVGRLCEAAGRPKSWGDRYWTLSGLIPELLDLLDLEDEEERLGFGAAIRLAPARKEEQMQVYLASEAHFKQGGHTARAAYIHQQVRELRISRGEKLRGRQINDKALLEKTAFRLRRVIEDSYGGRKSSEHAAFVKGTFSGMKVFELEGVIHNLRQAQQGLQDLLRKAEEERTAKMAESGLGVLKRA